MNLERLVNELLLDLFEFLTVNTVFRSFYDLSFLLIMFFVFTSDNFLSIYIYKLNFAILRLEYLPSTIDRIVSLRFRMIMILHSHFIFSSLKFQLLLVLIRTIMKMNMELHRLTNPIHLNIMKFRVGCNQLNYITYKFN